MWKGGEPQTWLPRVRREVRGDLVYPLCPHRSHLSNILWKPTGWDSPHPTSPLPLCHEDSMPQFPQRSLTPLPFTKECWETYL